MRELRSDEARRGFRDLLDEVERDPAAAIRILRYERPVAVVVSDDWHERAALALTANEAALALHHRRDDGECFGCGAHWPCETHRVLTTGTARLRASVTTEPERTEDER